MAEGSTRPRRSQKTESPLLTPRSGDTLRNQATTASRTGLATQAVALRAHTLPRNTMVGGAWMTAKSPSSNSTANEAEPTPTTSRQRLHQQQPKHYSPMIGCHRPQQRGPAPEDDPFMAVAKEVGYRQ
ncbi:hypothetical protein MRX96_002238 [Rhipicephalus microplus]